jgi:hypothetical protein
MSGLRRGANREDPAADRVRFLIQADNIRRTIYFEPEGAEVTLGRDDALAVEISGGHGPREVELTIHPQGLSVWAWADAETAVWDRHGTPLDV